MGDSYSIRLKVKWRKGCKKRAVKDLFEYISHEDGNGVNFSLDRYKSERGIVPDSFDNIVRIFFADWGKPNLFQDGDYYNINGKNRLRKYDKNGFRIYVACFDASYGWGRVLEKFFDIITPYLSDDSEFSVSSDETNIDAVISDGQAIPEIYVCRFSDGTYLGFDNDGNFTCFDDVSYAVKCFYANEASEDLMSYDELSEAAKDESMKRGLTYEIIPYE